MMLLALAAAAAALPTDAEIAGAIAKTRGGPQPRVTQAHCAPSSPGFVRCTYLEGTASGYARFAVLVSNHGGRWSVSEGPIRERVSTVRKVR